MSNYGFEREARTPHSEVYSIEVEGETIGRVDLHLAPSTAVHATLCVPEAFDADDIEDLIAEVDARLVLTHDPDRADFVVTVWRGVSAGVYSEDMDDDEADDGDS